MGGENDFFKGKTSVFKSKKFYVGKSSFFYWCFILAYDFNKVDICSMYIWYDLYFWIILELIWNNQDIRFVTFCFVVFCKYFQFFCSSKKNGNLFIRRFFQFFVALKKTGKLFVRNLFMSFRYNLTFLSHFFIFIHFSAIFGTKINVKSSFYCFLPWTKQLFSTNIFDENSMWFHG